MHKLWAFFPNNYYQYQKKLKNTSIFRILTHIYAPTNTIQTKKKNYYFMSY